MDGHKYVNVDTTTDAGIDRASALGFSDKRQADLVISPFPVHAAKKLFSTKNKGAMFSLFRHPVDRINSMFYYLQSATWEPTYSASLANTTLLEYAKSPDLECNWMVRFLVDKPEGAIDEHDLEQAKRLVQDKCLVGLQTEMAFSLRMFGQVFGWDQHEKWNQCMGTLHTTSSNNHLHPAIDPRSEERDILRGANMLDMKLWAFVHEIYHQQKQQYPEIAAAVLAASTAADQQPVPTVVTESIRQGEAETLAPLQDPEATVDPSPEASEHIVSTTVVESETQPTPSDEQPQDIVVAENNGGEEGMVATPPAAQGVEKVAATTTQTEPPIDTAHDQRSKSK